jgi:hypothetical protein
MWMRSLTPATASLDAALIFRGFPFAVVARSWDIIIILIVIIVIILRFRNLLHAEMLLWVHPLDRLATF